MRKSRKAVLKHGTSSFESRLISRLDRKRNNDDHYDEVMDWFERERPRMKKYILLDSSGKPYESVVKGCFGGHRKLKIYGRLDCPSALRFIAKGQYVKYRVFFRDESDAISAGYRPCAKCLPERYKEWKNVARNTV